MPSAHRCFPLERFFVFLVLSSGLVIFFTSSMLSQDSQGDILRQYLDVKKRYNERIARQILSQEKMLNSNHSNRNNTSFNSLKNNNSVVRPVTDPPWIIKADRISSRHLEPFVPDKKQKHPFLRNYVIENQNLCSNSTVDLLIVIHSAVKNFQKRRILRETWAASNTLQDVSIRRIFSLGRDGSDNAIQFHINSEQATYGDLVQGDFVDTFRNLTLKALTTFRWINDHCLQARFVLKTDDDVFVNVFSMAENFLQRLSGQRHTVMCHSKATNKSVIVRDPKSKWYIPDSLLTGKTHWPAFCSGYLVVMTTDVVPALYRVSFDAPYLPVDDGFVYGVLPAMAGKHFLQYLDISNSLLQDEKALLSHYQKLHQPLTYVAGTVTQEESLVKLWQATLSRLSQWASQRARITRARRGRDLTDTVS